MKNSANSLKMYSDSRAPTLAELSLQSHEKTLDIDPIDIGADRLLENGMQCSQVLAVQLHSVII